MAILRAGPWGNLSDSFQNTPPAVNKRLYHYPVNIANGDWPNQEWLAWYEAEESGCCAPAQIEATWPVTDDFGSTVTYETQTIDISEDCTYLYFETPDSYYKGYVFELEWSGSAWICRFGNDDFAQADTSTLASTDECDPTGVTTISGSYYYDGYDITVTDPNA